MKSLTKKHQAELLLHIAELDSLESDVERAVGDYNNAIDELNEYLTEIAEEISTYIDGRSEAWQESDRAELYDTWMESFREEKDYLEEPMCEHNDFEFLVSVDDV